MRINGFTNIKTIMNLNKNAFSLLLDITNYFYCHNFGHKSCECKLKDNRLTSQNMYKTIGCMQWRKKEKEKKPDKCDLVLYAQDQNNKWYVDSGCSRHVIGDKIKFVSLNQNKIGMPHSVMMAHPT